MIGILINFYCTWEEYEWKEKIYIPFLSNIFLLFSAYYKDDHDREFGGRIVWPCWWCFFHIQCNAVITWSILLKKSSEKVPHSSHVRLRYGGVFCEFSVWFMFFTNYCNAPDSKVHGVNMGPIWGQQDPDGPHVDPMNFAIWDCMQFEVIIEHIIMAPDCIHFNLILAKSCILQILQQWSRKNIIDHAFKIFLAEKMGDSHC